jgi:hypothetical protein
MSDRTKLTKTYRKWWEQEREKALEVSEGEHKQEMIIEGELAQEFIKALNILSNMMKQQQKQSSSVDRKALEFSTAEGNLPKGELSTIFKKLKKKDGIVYFLTDGYSLFINRENILGILSKLREIYPEHKIAERWEELEKVRRIIGVDPPVSWWKVFLKSVVYSVLAGAILVALAFGVKKHLWRVIDFKTESGHIFVNWFNEIVIKQGNEIKRLVDLDTVAEWLQIAGFLLPFIVLGFWILGVVGPAKENNEHQYMESALSSLLYELEEVETAIQKAIKENLDIVAQDFGRDLMHTGKEPADTGLLGEIARWGFNPV